MKTEIERKFLVKNEAFKDEAIQSHRIIQGYLNKDPERTVRVRIINNQGWLTIKGKSNSEGTRRLEWEKAIPLEDAQQLMALTLNQPIEKIRRPDWLGEEVTGNPSYYNAMM